LPRPNSSTTINITMAQCQIEKEPINHSLMPVASIARRFGRTIAE
jgi:hypothetical protein